MGMIDEKKVDFGELKKAIKSINEDESLLKAIGIGAIKVVAVKKTALMETLVATVEKLSESPKAEEIPEAAVLMYNSFFVEADSAGADGTTDGKIDGKTDGKTTEAEKPTVPSKAKATAKKAASVKPKSCYGHIASAVSGQLDEALKTGGIISELMVKLGVTRGRINSHVKALKNKGLTVTETPGKSDGATWKDAHFSVKEKSI